MTRRTARAGITPALAGFVAGAVASNATHSPNPLAYLGRFAVASCIAAIVVAVLAVLIDTWLVERKDRP